MCVTQSLLASKLLGLIDTMLSANSNSVFVVLEGVFFVITGSATMAFATLKNKSGRLVMQGMLVGNLVATPLLAVVGNSLYQGVAGCKGFGDPTSDFPKGKPDQCDSDEKFLGMFYLMKAITWIVTLGSGMLGTVFETPIILFSSAMTGSELFMRAIIDLISTFARIASPDTAKDLVASITVASSYVSMRLLQSV